MFIQFVVSKFSFVNTFFHPSNLLSNNPGFEFHIILGLIYEKSWARFSQIFWQIIYGQDCDKTLDMIFMENLGRLSPNIWQGWAIFQQNLGHNKQTSTTSKKYFMGFWLNYLWDNLWNYLSIWILSCFLIIIFTESRVRYCAIPTLNPEHKTKWIQNLSFSQGVWQN